MDVRRCDLCQCQVGLGMQAENIIWEGDLMYHDIFVPIAFDHEHDLSASIKLAGILATPNANITLLHVVEQPHVVLTDKLRPYGAAMNAIGNAQKQEIGRWLNNLGENSHQPYRRREHAMSIFREWGIRIRSQSSQRGSLRKVYTKDRQLSNKLYAIARLNDARQEKIEEKEPERQSVDYQNWLVGQGPFRFVVRFTRHKCRARDPTLYPRFSQGT